MEYTKVEEKLNLSQEVPFSQGEVMNAIEYVPKNKVIGKVVSRGRPLKYQSPGALSKRINAYFKECDEKKIPYTMSGLALSLSISRQTLLVYEGKEYYGFGNIIEEAKTRVENYAEKALFSGKCIGAIFTLKNNFPGWQENRDVTVRGPLGTILDEIQKYAKDRGIIKTSKPVGREKLKA